MPRKRGKEGALQSPSTPTKAPPRTEPDKLVEVYEVLPGKGREGFTFQDGAIEFLPANQPLPAVGDIILLPRNVTGDDEQQAFAGLRLVAPFRVVDREHLYFRDPGEKHDPFATKPALYLKSWIFVQRLSREEYGRDPGSK